jgi:hypothetical protein
LLRRLPGEEVARSRSEWWERQPLRRLEAESTLVRQTFERASTGYVMGSGGFYTYRFAGPHLYLLVTEEPGARQRTRFHLLTLEVERGAVVQELRIGEEPLSECRIEDVDERGLALSLEGRELRYYERV